jgi:hypothetical protein
VKFTFDGVVDLGGSTVTIDSLLNDPALTRQSIKPAFASLTIGSGSAAIVLCDRKLLFFLNIESKSPIPGQNPAK